MRVFHPLFDATYCASLLPRAVREHVGHDADRGVIVWVGSHIIRRGSGVSGMVKTALRPSAAGAAWRLAADALPARSARRSRAFGASIMRASRARCAAATAAAARSIGAGSMPAPIASADRLKVYTLDTPARP